MIFWLFLACGGKQPGATRVDPVEQTEKQGVAMRVERVATATGSDLEITFLGDGEAVLLEAWGASGLLVEGERARIEHGTVHTGEVLRFSVPHTGDGDLALRIAGRWNGEEGEDVRSFTVGKREATEVPVRTVDGEKVKGWTATPR